MKIFGYSNNEQDIENIVPSELAEISLVASPEELRCIAKFLEGCAKGIEASSKSWEHEHLADKDSVFKNSPHFVVFNPEHSK